MSIGMKELAALAGVSQTTVSLVLNGKADGRIARVKQERVRELAKQYNYRPNLSARSLREQKRYTIGVCMPMPVNNGYSDMLSQVQEKLAERGYAALFSFWKNTDDIEKALESIFQHNVGGIITWDYHECLEREKIPAVIYESAQPGFDAVLLDYDSSSRILVEYLMRQGHREIGYLGRLQDSRSECLRRELSRAGLPVRDEWFIPALGTLHGGSEVMPQFLALEKRPTVLVAQNDAVAAAAVFHAVRSGIRVPEDLSVTGFDNTVTAAFTLPPLTTFDIHPKALTDALVDLLMQRLKNPERPVQHCRIRPELVIRESVKQIQI